jgi:hypothetical protein
LRLGGRKGASRKDANNEAVAVCAGRAYNRVFL